MIKSFNILTREIETLRRFEKNYYCFKFGIIDRVLFVTNTIVALVINRDVIRAEDEDEDEDKYEHEYEHENEYEYEYEDDLF